MPDVFISYKREERPRVERLAAALTSLKFDVWFDAELLPGVTFLDEIQHALDVSRAVIVCWTPAAARSAHVLGEAEHGRRQSKLVAAFFAECPLPSPFNMIHAEDLSTWVGDVGDTLSAWRKILGSISALTQRPALQDFVNHSLEGDAAALRGWANDNWKDPLATEAVELARRLEAGEVQAAAVRPASRARNAAPPATGSGAPTQGNTAIERLGPKAVQAASADDGGEALVNLGRDYLEGFGAVRDYEAARMLFELAAQKGAPYASFNLGLMYLKGQGVLMNHTVARKHFEVAASRGVGAALTNLGIIQEQGLSGPRDFAKALHYYELAAAAGEDVAIANIAVLYGAGRGVRQDWSEARRLFEKAAQKGNASALDNLGTIYARGFGVAPNYPLARQCYESAAELGDVSAFYNLGVFHLEGKGGPDDPSKALSYFERAAHLGHASATANLAAMYANGVGVRPDLDRAVALLNRAAELGSASAVVNLGRIFGDRSSHLFNLQLARARFSQACDRGDEQGCFHLAQMLASGEGGAMDRAVAARIFERLSKDPTSGDLRGRAKTELSRLGIDK
ncbi:MAG: TIR domain-containing protein [Hyphomonadaceae bacterium]